VSVAVKLDFMMFLNGSMIRTRACTRPPSPVSRLPSTRSYGRHNQLHQQLPKLKFFRRLSEFPFCIKHLARFSGLAF